MKNKLYNKEGFTLLEIIIVIIIISSLASLAVPSFNGVVEKTKSREGVQILEAFRKAQLAYFYENGNQFANAANLLDVTVTGSDHFQNPIAVPGADIDDSIVATVARNAGEAPNDYTLSINANGTLTCTPANATCTRVDLP